MTRFRYVAATAGGETTEGEIEQSRREQVVELLQQRGYIPIRVDQIAETARPSSRFRIRRRGRMKADGIAAFTTDLATLIEARLPVDRALSVMQSSLAEGPGEQLTQDLQQQVRGGVSLADALSASDVDFPRFYGPMVRAGEASGSLGLILRQLSEELRKSLHLKETISSAIRYPVIVLALSFLTIVLVFSYVVPEFQRLFEGSKATLPLMTRIVFAISDLIQHYGWLMIASILLVLLVIRFFSRRPDFSLRADRILLNLPVIGGLIVQRETARFCGVLSMLLHGGNSILDAVAIALQTIENSAFASELSALPIALKRGVSLANGLQAAPSFPVRAIQLVRVGEESGRMREMLAQTADIFSSELRRDLDRSLSLLGPALTIGLGIMVAGTIAAILSAIMTAYELPF